MISKLPIVIFEGASVDLSHGHSPLHSSLISKPGFLQFSNSISQDSEYVFPLDPQTLSGSGSQIIPQFSGLNSVVCSSSKGYKFKIYVVYHIN